MSNLEELANKMVDDFKVKMITEIKQAAEESINNLYCDILPHVESDTLFNVNSTTTHAVKSLLEGRFTVTDDNKILLTDRNGLGFRIRLDDKWNTTILNSIIEAMPNCPKDIKIKQLEDRITALANTISRY